jgi:hypothetical protein
MERLAIVLTAAQRALGLAEFVHYGLRWVIVI